MKDVYETKNVKHNMNEDWLKMRKLLNVIITRCIKKLCFNQFKKINNDLINKMLDLKRNFVQD
jgi:hypothetical protein